MAPEQARKTVRSGTPGASFWQAIEDTSTAEPTTWAGCVALAGEIAPDRRKSPTEPGSCTRRRAGWVRFVQDIDPLARRRGTTVEGRRWRQVGHRRVHAARGPQRDPRRRWCRAAGRSAHHRRAARSRRRRWTDRQPTMSRERCLGWLCRFNDHVLLTGFLA
jgi:hypothetical protein